MAETFNFKKGNTENLGLRWLGSYQTNSRARYGTSDSIIFGGKFVYVVDSNDITTYPSAFSGTAQNFADYWNNPANYSFRTHIIENKVPEKIYNETVQDYGDYYVRAMSEWDTIVIPAGYNLPNLQYNVFEYVDLRRVQKLTYKGYPVFRLKKDGVTIFQRQIASGASAKVGYTARTMTSIDWRVTNDDDANILADVYAIIDTVLPSVSTLYSSGSNPTGTLNNTYKKNSTKIAGGNYVDFISEGLIPNTSYRCTSVLGDNTTSLYHSLPGYGSAYTDQGIVVSFLSATSSSITFNYTNKTSSTTTRIYAGTTSPGNTQVSSTSVASNGNTTATLTGLSPNTSYTIYVRGYTGSTYTSTASFTGKTLSSLEQPVIGSIDGAFCNPNVEIINPNDVTVTVFAGVGVNPTTSYGVLYAYETGTFFIDVGANPAGQNKTFYVRFYNASQGYSASSHGSVTIAKRCLSNPGL